MNGMLAHIRARQEPVAKTGRRVPLVVLIALLVCYQMMPQLPVSSLFMRALDQRFQPVAVDAIGSAAGIIALGGGGGTRVVEAGHLARRHPHLKVIVTGAGEPGDIWNMLGSGIDRNRVVIDTLAETTRDNAHYVRQILGYQATQRWLLVTSASHMPRAVGAFRKKSITVLPWPIPDQVTPWRTSADLARHEWLGLIWYRAIGATSDIFPSAT
jgi:uncharacterized SAM-binding protein YcdF (DUF218 family)